MSKGFIMKNLSQNIVALRNISGKKQKEACEEIGISASALSAYEKGIREPSLGAIVKLAQYYNVSTDYLLGLEKNSNQMKTQADFLRHIIAIEESSVQNSLDCEFANPQKQHQFCKICIFSEWVSQFIEGYKTIASLKKERRINEEQYDVLVKNFLEGFEKPL